MSKDAGAFRTISEVSGDLDLPQHVLRFWESKFSQLKPLKRGGGRRYYRPDEVALLQAIRTLLYDEGYTIKGVQRILKEQGARLVARRVSEHTGMNPDETEQGSPAALTSDGATDGPTALAATDPATTGAREGDGGPRLTASAAVQRRLADVIRDLDACRAILADAERFASQSPDAYAADPSRR